MGRSRTATARRRPRALTKAVNAATAIPMTATPVQRPFGLMEALNAATNHGLPPGVTVDYRPMPRDPADLGAFGPGQPIQPEPIDPLDPRTGRPEPRVWEYPQSWNLPGNNRREVPWQVLRAAASGIGIIRRCIEVRKAHVADLQWSWSVRPSVVERAYNTSRTKGYEDIAAELREEHHADIERLTARWERPWPHQDLSFYQWIRMVVEELQVIDAGVIYPRMSLGGDVLDLELVDGSTIKPLLDHRGIRPSPPFPAYQQETWGFPRGEWAASTTLDEHGNEVVDNGFASSEMFYFRANPRVTSPYGLSPVEQALYDSRLYMKRMQWMLAEYDDGSTPLTVWEVPENPGQEMKPQDRRIWEESVNAEFNGNSAARHRMKVGAPGWTIKQLSSADERYKPDFDLFLVKLVAGHFGVTATELGFSETTGLGSAGWQEGQAEVGGRVGLRPDVRALTELINGVSRQFLNAPPELEFSFIDPASENDKDSDSVADAQLKRAVITLNDDRRRLKLPLFSFPEADMPMLVGVGTAGYVFVDGAKQAADEAAAAAVKAQEAAAEGATGKLELEDKKIEDGKQARKEEHDLQRENRDAEHDFAREQMKADTTKAATPDGVHTGAMVALVPSEADAERLAVDGGEPAGHLHLTLMYLGKAADIPAEAQRRIVAALRSTVEDAIRPDYDLPLHGDGFAISAFNMGHNDREPCIVLGVGGKDVAAVHAMVLDTIGEVRTTVGGLFPLPEQLKPWVPHVTLVYTDDVDRVAELADRVGPITFDRLRVSFAGQTVDIPLVPVVRAADVEKAVAAELHAFANWRRRNPNPKRPFVFKTATPDDFAAAPPGPDVCSFGDEWVWLFDEMIEKASKSGLDWRAWNRLNPGKQKDSRGRWAKRSDLTGWPLLDSLRDMSNPSRHLVDTDIQSMDDNQLMDFFAEMSRRDQLDEPLIHRLLEDMDRRERNTPFAGLGDDDLTDEQKRVDELVGKGRDYLFAYAEVHGQDDAKLSAGEAASAVDRQRGETLQQAVRRSYDEWLHMTYLEAEKGTRGNMLNRAGKKAGIDPLTLFTGPVSRARRYASEDLMRWWRQNKRMNLTEFRAQVLRRDRDRAAAAVTAAQSTGRDYL